MKDKMQKMSSTFGAKIAQQIKNLDMFGHQMSLKYKGEDTFKTTFGGVITAITLIGVFTLIIS